MLKSLFFKPNCTLENVWSTSHGHITTKVWDWFLMSSHPNQIWRYNHYKQVTMMLLSSHQCFAACTQQSDKWNITVLTCSVTFCAVSKSCSPSGSTSGSTMGTRPFWRHKIYNQKLTTTNHKQICQISSISCLSLKEGACTENLHVFFIVRLESMILIIYFKLTSPTATS